MDEPTLDPVYLKQLKPTFEQLFIQYIKPVNVLHVFHKYNKDILTDIDLGNIDAKAKNDGPIAGSILLFERLVLYKGWYPCLLKVLCDRGVCLSHVAQAMEEIKGSLDDEILQEESDDQSATKEKWLAGLSLYTSGLTRVLHIPPNTTNLNKLKVDPVLEKRLLKKKVELERLQKELDEVKQRLRELNQSYEQQQHQTNSVLSSDVDITEKQQEQCKDCKEKLKQNEKLKNELDQAKLVQCDLKSSNDKLVLEKEKLINELDKAKLVQHDLKSSNKELLLEKEKIQKESADIKEQLNLAKKANEELMRKSSYYDERDDIPINIVLVGGCGNGKSATGNSILRKHWFTSKPSTTPVTKCFSKESTELDGKIINVIDGPGIDASAEQLQQNLEMIIDTTEQALEMCNYNFSALLIVMKFGIRFTKQERDSVYIMKAILGSDVLQKYGICILTHGDRFQDGINSFDNWCRNQNGEMTKIIKECGNRCILFNNKAKDETTKMKQVRQLMSMMKNNTQYSKKEFEMAEEERRKLIIEITFPELKAQTELKLTHLRHRLSTAEMIQEKKDDYLREINSILKDTAHIKELLSQMLQANTIVQPLIDNIEAFDRELKSKLKYSTLKDESGSKVQAYGQKTPNTPSYRYDQEQHKAQLNHQGDLFASPSKSTKDKGQLKRDFTHLIEFFK